MNYFTLARRKHPYLRALKGSPTIEEARSRSHRGRAKSGLFFRRKRPRVDDDVDAMEIRVPYSRSRRFSGRRRAAATGLSSEAEHDIARGSHTGGRAALPGFGAAARAAR